MNSKQKRQLYRIIITALLLAGALVSAGESFPSFALGPVTLTIAIYLVAYLLIGGSTLLKALRNIGHGQIFDENFLMSIATIGALALGDFPEAISVMLFYQVGELFESYAVDKSRKSIAGLMDIRPDYANLLRDGIESRVDPYQITVGDTIVVKPGEKIPLDGKILTGHSTLDTSALTGESLPKDVMPGEYVISGCVNLSGLMTVEVTKEFEESTVAKILDLVENASSKKAGVEKFITKFARYYTPIVVGCAAFLGVVPPLVIPEATFGEWAYRALVFLVVSCPCALVISIPLSFFGGVGGASKIGVLVKGGNYLEALAKTEIVVFDKTGTLTQGNFSVNGIHCNGDNTAENRAKLLELAAYAENYSEHPISVSIKEAYTKRTGLAIDASPIESATEIPGNGTKISLGGKEICAGNHRFMESLGITNYIDHNDSTAVHVALDGIYIGCITISDNVKSDAKAAIGQLKAMGIKKTVMLTGDKDAIGRRVANELGIDKVFSELLPGDKVDRIEQLFSEKSPSGKLIFVGDGINDAPVLARADIGVAMGGLGSQAAIEAADIVIMTDEPSKLAAVIGISKRTLGIAKQNVIFALGIKAVVLLLAAMGFASMWAAIFADVGVSVLAILNAMRALKVK